MIHKVFDSSNEKSSIDQQLEENIFFNLSENNLSDDDLSGMNIARTEKAKQQIWQGIRTEKKGNFEQAIAHYRLAIEEDPESAKAYQLLSNALKKIREQRQYRSSNLNKIKSEISESLVKSYVAFKEVTVEETKDANFNQVSQVSGGHKSAKQKTEPKAPPLDGLSSQQPISNLSQTDMLSSSMVLNPGKETVVLPSVSALPSGELVLQKSLSAAEIYVEQALAYFEQKQWDESIAACKEALRICPDIGEAYKVWGNCLQQSGHSAKAIGIYAKALEVQPDMADIYCNLGSIYAKQQKWQRSIEYYQKSSLINPKNASSYRNLAKVWNRLGEYEKSAECFFKALELEPGMISAQNHFDLANNLLEENKLDRAIACYKYCVYLEANYFRAYVKLADALEKNGQTEEALFYYKRLAQLQAKEHQPLEAQAKSTQQIRSFLTSETGSSKPKMLLQGDSPQKSNLQLQPAKDLKLELQIKKCLEAVKQQPKSGEIWLQLGNLYLRNQQWQNAISSYGQAIKISPQEKKYYICLSKAWFKANDDVKACQSLFRGFALEPKGVSAKNYYLLGNKLLEQNQVKQAIACYRQAITNEANFIQAYWQLSKILTTQKKIPEAISYLRRAIKIQPKFQNAYLRLGDLFLLQKEYEGASACYRQLVKQNPQSNQGFHRLGDVLLKQEKWSEAAVAYQKAIRLFPKNSWSYQN